MQYYASMQKDVYKEYHVRAYHPQVSEVYTNFTNRSGKLSNVPNNSEVLFVGLQYFIKSYLIDTWNDTFFNLDKEEAVSAHKSVLSAMLGYEVDVTYLEQLHDLGYLPLEIKALPEGTFVPYQVAPLTVRNTVEGFQWLPNMIETVLSAELWPISTSATTSVNYFKRFKEAFETCGVDEQLIPFMGHDFSYRGMMGTQAAAMSGFGHLSTGFAGTDTIPAVLFAVKYYNANIEKELVGCSVDATEHSVTCSWIEEGEKEFFKYLMEEQSPTGILSVVSDTWDFWKLVTEYLPEMKDTIMSRDGKLVIRPDSGDPVDILCGRTFKQVPDWDEVRHGKLTPTIITSLCVNNNSGVILLNGEYYDTEANIVPEHEIKGLVECLWDTFSGTTTEEGYKLLDEHIGAIYGDSITIDRQEQIISRLMAKGFAPTVVLGIGSFSFQYVTRDTHGSAVKATNVVKNGKDMPIFKDPKTDSKKKSAKGLLRLEMEDGVIVQYDEQTRDQEKQGLLQTVFLDGELVKETNLNEIRSLVNSQL